MSQARMERKVYKLHMREGDGDRPTQPMKLLVLDVEGTLFKTKVRLPGTTIDSTIWQGIAYALGPEAAAAEVETHHKWHAGQYRNYMEWMADTIKVHQQHGLSKALFDSLVRSAEYNPGVSETLNAIDRNEYELVLISGGFRELARRPQLDFGIRHAFAACEYLFDREGRLNSFNLLPCDFQGKIDFIHLMLREYALAPSDWIFVGDGSNDVPIARAAPVSVAYGINPELRAAATLSVTDFRDLVPILTGSVYIPHVRRL